MERNGEFVEEQTYIPLKIRGGVYESCVRSVMLYGAETWQMKKRIENILKRCDRRMLRYMAGVSWTDRIPSLRWPRNVV